ncbi:hypothetical protein BJV78DRAFT_1158630 [Lactifluus subvellereus]|nr:hypothetical protein BJV78DRAFT_1158630 [Lactifluus subvellereus]
MYCTVHSNGSAAEPFAFIASTAALFQTVSLKSRGVVDSSTTAATEEVRMKRFTVFTRAVCIRAANFPALQELDMVLPVGTALEGYTKAYNYISVLLDRATLLAYCVVLSTSSSAGLLQTLNVPARHLVDVREIAQTLISEFRAVVAAAAPSATKDARRRKTEAVQYTQHPLSATRHVSRDGFSGKPKVLQTSAGPWLASRQLAPFSVANTLQRRMPLPILVEAELCAVPTIQALVLVQGIVKAHLNHVLSGERRTIGAAS